MRFLPLASIVLAPAFSLEVVAQQQQGGLAPGVSREQMWYAPTAEDWEKPCLIQWQRSYEDALAVSKETGKLILVCVNMDGEIASEHYAGVRYRQPEIAKLYEPYVCVIASVYRHSPRDFDEQGTRVLCPRFGTVTCGEHIAIEPLLHEKFMDGKRIAPRHIAVDPEKSEAELYDVYYALDTDTIFNALRDGVADRPAGPTIVRGDRPLVERVASRDSQDRAAVERGYAKADAATRRAMLEAALKNPDTEQLGLLRQAVFGFDTEMAKLARKALAQSTSAGSVDLIAESLRVPMESSERESLLATLDRLAEISPRARLASTIQRGLAGSSGSIDTERWAKALKEMQNAPAPDAGAIASNLDSQEYAAASRPQDPETLLALAEASLEFALERAANPNTPRKFVSLPFHDARQAALEAEKLGGSGWRLDATLAVAGAHLGDQETALARAEAAMKAMPAAPNGRIAASVLELFVRSRQQAIEKAIREKRDWAPQWLADVHAAYALLAKHPMGSEFHVANHYDFLRWLGGAAQAGKILDEGLVRFPAAPILHARLRRRVLEERGLAGLEPAYAARLAAKDASPHLEWFAGYASLVVAEGHRRAGKVEDALAAYDRGVAHFEAHIAKIPESRANSDHYVALALAGKARIALEARELEKALAAIVACFERKPDAAATPDGLNISPVDTAKMLLARAREAKKGEIVARIEAAFAKLDPEMLQLPAYERELPATPQNQ